MTDKQYADITTMMQFGRIFADQMYKCLKNTGLLDEGYRMKVNIGSCSEVGVRSSVAIDKNIIDCGYEEWKKTNVTQFYESCYEGWVVINDPKAEAGSLPPEVHIRKEGRTNRETVGATASKPYPPDGLWIGSFNHDSDVDGGQ